MIATETKTITISVDSQEATLLLVALRRMREQQQAELVGIEERAARGVGPDFSADYREELAKVEGMIRTLGLAGA